MTKIREILMNNKNVSYSQLVCVFTAIIIFRLSFVLFLTSWDSSILQGIREQNSLLHLLSLEH